MQWWPILPIALATAILALSHQPLGAQERFDDAEPLSGDYLAPFDSDRFRPSNVDSSALGADSLERAISPTETGRSDDERGPPGEERSPFMARVYWMPTQDVKGQGKHWSQAGEQISVAAPFYIASEGGNLWLATGTFDHLSINTGAILPDSQLPVPDNLWKIEGGMMNFRDLDNGWKSAAIFKVGSVSDQPFANVRDMTVVAIGSLEVPYRERDAWIFSFFYSPTSQLPFPVPGLAYAWRPSDQFRANIGIPFSLQYQPTETFGIVASYFPLTNANILARRQLSDNWTAYCGYQVFNETYWLDGRLDNQQRLYLFDQRLTLGLQRKLIRGLSIDISSGYVFDRKVFQADGFSENRRDEIALDPGSFGAVQWIWSL